MSTITLEKRGQAISLEKKGASFGDIRVNLNWSRGKRGLLGFSRAVDLDLGCLYELRNGDKAGVQALGRRFGSFDSEPYIQLMGDDRTGDAAQGETMRINGARWPEIRRIGIFAFIYEGAPNWLATNGAVTIAVPGQETIEIRMTEGRNDRGFCGIVELENINGDIKVTRIVDYYGGHQEFDRAHGWGLNWVSGRK